MESMQKYNWRTNRQIIMDVLENQAIGLILKGIEINTKQELDVEEDHLRKRVLYHHVDEIREAKNISEFKSNCSCLLVLMKRYQQAMSDNQTVTRDEIREYQTLTQRITVLRDSSEISEPNKETEGDRFVGLFDPHSGRRAAIQHPFKVQAYMEEGFEIDGKFDSADAAMDAMSRNRGT